MCYNAIMDNTNGEKPNGSERTYFKPGNKAAVGHKGYSLKAVTKRFLREYLTEKLADEILEAQAIKALDGDNAAAKFVFDYCGQRPVEEHADVSSFDLLMEKLRIPVQGRDAPQLR